MSDRKSPVERAINLFVYAPVGLLTLAREELPHIIEKGRQELTNQATVAKMMGEYAVAEGRKEASRRLEQAGDAVGSLRAVTDRRTNGPAPAASTTAASPPPAPSPPAPPTPAPAPAGATPPVVTPAPAPGPVAPAVGALAIPGYDALSASQVVQRLAGLSGPELEDVRAYEAATRGRKTILNRVEQLRAGTSS
ncbi:MAG: hypothetical protein QOE35_3838 [Actinomycetota bacterium]